MESDFREIVLATIGSEAQTDEIGPTFNFQSKTYKILLQSPNFDQLLKLHKSSGFFLKKLATEGKEHVVLCYNNNRITNPLLQSARQHRLFVANAFFDVVDGDDESMPKFNPEADLKQLTTDEFYERLRQKHLEDDLVTGIPTEVQHSSLRPVLRPYQKKSISWMLSRELVPCTLPKHWVKLRSKSNPSQELYFNKHTQKLVLECPKLQQTPKGGLLTDEMGLGKTVEVIALILMNPYRPGTELEASEVDENVPPLGNSTEKNSASTVKCICCKVDGPKTLLLCTLCSHMQHGMCIFRREVTAEDQVNYVCPSCWKSSGKIIDAKTTIVVMPSSIKSQWKDEIQRHVADKSFKVFMYEGVSRGWVHPTELAKYDVILIDFSLLDQELYHSEAEERSLRKSSKKYEYPPSPLTLVRWWRVVLDEAQTIEKRTSRPSQMLKQLPTVHRWATTGTPIERNSLQCLYGLLLYLNLDPYTNVELFNQMFTKYQSGKHDDLINVVSTVMWRTCKKNVQFEINLPKQSEVVHEVTMTDLQACYYRQALAEKKPQFMKKVQDYLLRNGPVEDVTKQIGGKTVTVRERTVDLSMKNTFLYRLNNANLNVFLKPLETLRQDCTIVRKLQRDDQSQTRVNTILRPEQLLRYLVRKTIDESKSAWRAVCSNLNGLAAVKTVENKYQEAIELYKQVLKQAEDHEKFADLMQQIRAYNSLLDIAALTGEKDDNHDEYASKMVRLEWEYISKFYGQVKEINREHRKHEPEMEKTMKDLADEKDNWWRDIVNKHRNEEEDGRLMGIINTECFQSVTDILELLENVRTTLGISRIIAEWSAKIQRYMNEVDKRFTSLDFVVNKLRPSNELSAEEKSEICTLAQAAANCHLESANPTLQESCELCKLKANLDEFECVLFNKSFVSGIVEGSWDPRFEEKLLKAVLIYGKRSNFKAETLEVGNCFFKHLEVIKTQFKIYAKLWVGVNRTVSAYDELEIGKTRMQLVESTADVTEHVRFPLKIARDQVPRVTQLFTSKKQNAEIKFALVNGRLKYLENLKIQPTCPVCLEEPQDRYYAGV